MNNVCALNYCSRPRNTVDQFKAITGVHFTMNPTGKMAGVPSLSTSPACNKNCEKMSKCAGTACAECYSRAMIDRYGENSAHAKRLEDNTKILTADVIPSPVLPYIGSPSGCFRFESFGDLNNTTQLVNYCNIAAVNDHLSCAVWTKLPWIIDDAIKAGAVIPENMRVIGSSYCLNVPMTNYYKRFSFITNIFTVYTADYAFINDIPVTCGGRSCAACGYKCYLNGHGSYEINEILKKDWSRYKLLTALDGVTGYTRAELVQFSNRKLRTIKTRLEHVNG